MVWGIDVLDNKNGDNMSRKNYSSEEKNFVRVFGKCVKLVREKQKLTQEQLSMLADRSYPTINNIESGKIVCDICTMYQILKALNVSLEELLSYAEDAD